MIVTSTLCKERQVLENRANLEEMKVKEGYHNTNKVQRMRERRKGPKYWNRENERQREQKASKKLQEKRKGKDINTICHV